MQHLQFVPIAILIFMSLHVPPGACILFASVSPIHVPPVQCALTLETIKGTSHEFYYDNEKFL